MGAVEDEEIELALQALDRVGPGEAMMRKEGPHRGERIDCPPIHRLRSKRRKRIFRRERLKSAKFPAFFPVGREFWLFASLQLFQQRGHQRDARFELAPENMLVARVGARAGAA